MPRTWSRSWGGGWWAALACVFQLFQLFCIHSANIWKILWLHLSIPQCRMQDTCVRFCSSKHGSTISQLDFVLSDLFDNLNVMRVRYVAPLCGRDLRSGFWTGCWRQCLACLPWGRSSWWCCWSICSYRNRLSSFHNNIAEIELTS